MITIKSPRLRKTLRIAMPFIAIPAAVLLGATVFREKGYAFVSLAVAVMAVIYFISGFDKKRVGSRRLVTVSVMTALATVGRFIPFLKPVAALTAISGVWLGSEAGFLTGAMSALVSNFYFGQGPWTPFQMLSWGLIGLVAGKMSEVLRRGRLPMLIYGAVSGIFFSAVMDIWTVVWYSGGISSGLYLAAIVAAIPHTALYAVSNVIFLLLLQKPFGEKFGRIKLKYGL